MTFNNPNIRLSALHSIQHVFICLHRLILIIFLRIKLKSIMEVNDEQEDQLSEINFVPCVKFVKRGIAAPKTIADVRIKFYQFPHGNKKNL